MARHRAKRRPRPLPWPERLRRRQQQAIAWIRLRALSLLMILFGLFALLVFSLWLGVVLPQQHLAPMSCSASPLTVSLRYPRFVTAQDESFVEVGLRNAGSQPISGTVVITFGGDLVVHPLLDKTNVLSFSALPPEGIMAGQVGFTLNEPPTRWRGTLPFSVQVRGDALQGG